MARGDLSDAQWERLCPLLPVQNGRGRPYRDHRQVLNGILWILRTGAPWRDLPEHYGPWQSAYDRFRRWQRSGLWQRLLQALQQESDRGQAVDWEGCAVDSTTIKAHPHAGGLGRIVRPGRKKGALSRGTASAWGVVGAV